MIEKFMEFMQGRHGFDKLGLALIIAACAISFLSRLLWLPQLYILTIILDIAFIYRFLSKKDYARTRENAMFVKWFETVKTYLRRDNKNYTYCKCPVCKTQFSVPKNNGGAKAVCPKCGNMF